MKGGEKEYRPSLLQIKEVEEEELPQSEKDASQESEMSPEELALNEKLRQALHATWGPGQTELQAAQQLYDQWQAPVDAMRRGDHALAAGDLQIFILLKRMIDNLSALPQIEA